MIEQNSITIIGKGALGSTLYDFFKKESYRIQSVWDRNGVDISTKPDQSMIRLEKNLPTKENEIGDMVFITVPDDQIKPLSDSLSLVPLKWEKRSIIHCSGNLSSDSCSSLKKRGSTIASMHPIQTFTKGDSADRFSDIYVTLEGDEELISDLMLMVKKMGAHPLKITSDQKKVIHIASVIASNYLVSLLHISETLLKEAGIREDLELLQPLVSQTVQNVFGKGTTDSLTGPISRGDISSVNHHLHFLKTNQHYSDIYKLLGKEAVIIAQKRGELSEKITNELLSSFEK